MAEYEPLIIERAEGCTLFDIDGNAYLDGVSSLWCNVHGHRHPQARCGHSRAARPGGPRHELWACRIRRRSNSPSGWSEIAPPGLNHVFFSSDGATAVEVALKMAFQYWRQRTEPQPEKTRTLAFDNAYHGDTLGSVSVGGVERFHAMFEPLLFTPASVAVRNSRQGKGPTYAKRGIVVPDAGGGGRRVEDRHHIAHAGRRLERLESMGEARRNV